MLTRFLNTFFPRRCVGCGREGESWICQDCVWQEENWPREAYPGIQAFSNFKHPLIREAIHALKYHGVHELAEELVTMLFKGEQIARETILVPVPTTFRRRKKRGYNQAELIANVLGQRLGLSVATNLLVKTAAGSQVGKNREERQAAGYALRKGAIIPHGPLVLVDDLCTTGSTLRACRAALQRDCPAIVLALD